MSTSPLTVPQCATCAVERADPVPDACPICADERQFVPTSGQRWTSPEESRAAGARIEFVEFETDVVGLVPRSCPGIGQKPALIRTAHGNVLVEAPTVITPEAVAAVRGWGGIAAIIASHPHMYGVQSLWSEAFDDAPVYVSAADEHWLGVRPRNTIVWGGKDNGADSDGDSEADSGGDRSAALAGQVEILPGVRASQPGGHFPGSAVVHWTAPDGAGVLFTGDTIGTVADPRWVTFMRSFPNWLPLSGAVVRRIAEHVAYYEFDRLYGNFGGCVPRAAREVVLRSADRYAAWVDGEYDHLT